MKLLTVGGFCPVLAPTVPPAWSCSSARGNTASAFLDEIGELPTPLQVEMLRFSQDHKVERIGGRTTIPVDVRVITATNADLTKLMAEGRFREDLYYRIGVVTLSRPPLRDREDDVVLIADTLRAPLRHGSRSARAARRPREGDDQAALKRNRGNISRPAAAPTGTLIFRLKLG